MKLTTLILLFAGLTTNCFSQIEKRLTMLGIQVGGAYAQDSFLDKWNYKKEWNYNITLACGKAIAKNVVAGGQFTQSRAIYDNRWQVYGYKKAELLLGFFIRQYHPLGKNVYIWMHESINYMRNEQTGLQGRSWGLGYAHNISSSGIGVTIYPGISYSVSKRLQIELSYRDLFGLYWTKSVDYIFVTGSPKLYSAAFYPSINRNLLSSWQLGIRFIYPKKTK